MKINPSARGCLSIIDLPQLLVTIVSMIVYKIQGGCSIRDNKFRPLTSIFYLIREVEYSLYQLLTFNTIIPCFSTLGRHTSVWLLYLKVGLEKVVNGGV